MQAMKYDTGRGRELAEGLCAQIAHYLLKRIYGQANKKQYRLPYNKLQ